MSSSTRFHCLFSGSTAMDARLIRRPISSLFSSRCQCLLVSNIARRHESTSRRTTKALNIKPGASFLLSKSSPSQDHIIFNPPSSQPSVFHTPLTFLPKEDKRRQLLAKTAAKQPPQTRLAPIIPKYKPIGLKHHLKDEDVTEMRKLRLGDPVKWTFGKLAKKYNCSIYFVRICTARYDSLERRQVFHAKLEAVQARWGPKRKMAREDRLKRWELALRDE